MAGDWFFWLRKNVIASCIKSVDYGIELNSSGNHLLSNVANIQLELACKDVLAELVGDF